MEIQFFSNLLKIVSIYQRTVFSCSKFGGQQWLAEMVSDLMLRSYNIFNFVVS